jgi:hypothetical protein
MSKPRTNKLARMWAYRQFLLQQLAKDGLELEHGANGAGFPLTDARRGKEVGTGGAASVDSCSARGYRNDGSNRYLRRCSSIQQ